MAKVLKPKSCSACPITHVTGDHWAPPQIIPTSSILLVGEAASEHDIENGAPFSGAGGAWLSNMLAHAGIKRSTHCSTAQVMACQPPGGILPSDPKWRATSRADGYAALSYCARTHLEPALRAKPWKKIIACGEGALNQLTGKKGILVWRGSPLPLRGGKELKVIPTLAPSYLARDSKYVSVTINDLRKNPTVVPERYALYCSASGLLDGLNPRFAFDLEWDHNGDISLCGISDRLYTCRVAGWNGEVAARAKDVFERATDLIGVQVLTTFGWRWLGAYRSREAAEAVAEEAKASGRYQRVRIN